MQRRINDPRIGGPVGRDWHDSNWNFVSSMADGGWEAPDKELYPAWAHSQWHWPLSNKSGDS